MSLRRCRVPPKCANRPSISLRLLSTSGTVSAPLASDQKPFYVTSPIFYVNAAPHIGHLYSMVVADIFTRWEAMRNPSRAALYTTGTDEHGMKIQEAAEAQKVSPQQLCDVTSKHFENLATATGIASTNFIRTTARRHADAVEHVWRRLIQKGHIYKGVHSGWYAVSDEAFYTPSQIEPIVDATGKAIGHKSKETGKEVVWTDEENYKFRLSAFRRPLIEWIQQSSPILPRKRQDEILEYLSDEGSVRDLSVSRPKTRVKWGIPVPEDPTHTIYVWLDALTSYMTAVGLPWKDSDEMRLSGWPADIHVVGKDIIRFHAVYFPAFLMALDLPLPRGILCHAHWTMNKQKMSKSVGNVVDPFLILDTYGVDSVRWYLARIGGNFVDDVDWDLGQLEILHDRDLRGLGNLYKRLHAKSMCGQGRFGLPGSVTDDAIEKETVESLMSLSGEVTGEMMTKSVSRVIDAIMTRIDLINRYITHREPWKNIDPASQGRTLALGRESLRICSILLQPFLPSKAALLLNWLGVPNHQRSLIWAAYGAVQGVGGVPATADQKLVAPIK